MNRNPVTPAGYEALQRDLKHHKEVLRPQNVRAIEEARAHGDISENAEYSSAKEQQSMLAGKIADLERLVSSAEIIDVTKLPKKDGRVVFGVTVKLENKDGTRRTWRIVGESEADLANGLISYQTPVAKALIGKTEGEEVVIPAPGGTQKWEIIEVLYV
jgi:transcription elongation factor GreA